MVSKNLPMGINIVDVTKTLIFCGYLEVRIFYTQVIIQIDALLNCADIRAILSRFEGSCMVYRHKMVLKTKIPSSIHTILVSKM